MAEVRESKRLGLRWQLREKGNKENELLLRQKLPEKPTEKERTEAELRSLAIFGKHVYSPIEYCMHFSDYI